MMLVPWFHSLHLHGISAPLTCLLLALLSITTLIRYNHNHDHLKLSKLGALHHATSQHTYINAISTSSLPYITPAHVSVAHAFAWHPHMARFRWHNHHAAVNNSRVEYMRNPCINHYKKAHWHIESPRLRRLSRLLQQVVDEHPTASFARYMDVVFDLKIKHANDYHLNAAYHGDDAGTAVSAFTASYSHTLATLMQRNNVDKLKANVSQFINTSAIVPVLPAVEDKQQMMAMLDAYARLLIQPSGDNATYMHDSILPSSMQARSCDVLTCYTVCCCMDCLLNVANKHGGIPADHTSVWKHPLENYTAVEDAAAIDAQLDILSANQPLPLAAEYTLLNESTHELLSAPPPLPPMQHGIMPRIAVLLSGQARTFSTQWPMSKLHLIDTAPMPVDIYIHAWHDGYHEDIMPTLEATNTSHLVRGLMLEPELHAPDVMRDGVQCKWKNVPWSAHPPNFESMRRASRMKRLVEHQAQAKYTWVVRLRFDVALMSDVWQQIAGWRAAHPDLLDHAPHMEDGATADPDRIIVDKHERHIMLFPACGEWRGGYNDQFAIGTSDVMHMYAERPRVLHRCYGMSNWEGMHSETCLRKLMMHESYAYNMHIAKLPFCYYVRRVASGKSNVCKLSNLNYGKDCCLNDGSTQFPKNKWPNASSALFICPLLHETQQACEQRINNTHACKTDFKAYHQRTTKTI